MVLRQPSSQNDPQTWFRKQPLLIVTLYVLASVTMKVSYLPLSIIQNKDIVTVTLLFI
jgi:hypothetical protein